MRFTRASRDANRSGSGGVRTIDPPAHAPQQETHTRFEPQTVESRVAARDPYALWLARQESARERIEGEEIRWVYRYPRVTHPAAPTVAEGRADAAASDPPATFMAS
jgi:hypothetical protein